MLRLKDFNGVASKGGDVGIEIEVESKNPLPPIENDLWISKKEDSLRFNGMEYITNRPIKVNPEKYGKIEQLISKLEKYEIIQDSLRTSVHVHVNVSKLDLLHIYNAMCAYWLFENVLTRFCGEDREGNLFCLRLKDAEALAHYVIDGLNSKNGNPFYNLTDRVRYAGMNTNALNKFGSLEFRTMRGTLRPKLIDEWSTELYNLVTNAGQFNHPAHMFDVYLLLSKHEFMAKFFSENFAAKLRKINGWEDMIDESAALVCTIAYEKDWPKWYESIKAYWADGNKPVLKKPKVNNMYTTVNTISIDDLQSYITGNDPPVVITDDFDEQH